MTVYLDGVMLLNFLVDFLLLLGAARLCGFPVKAGRAVVGGLLGGLYAAFAYYPALRSLGISFGVP